MALRSTYDTGVYGSGLYGEQETTQAAASASFAISASASAVTVVSGASSASISLSASNPTGVIVKDASVSATLQGLVNVSAVSYEVVAGFRSGYGLNTFGSYIYGENYSVEEASVSASISFSASASAQAVRQVSASPEITVTASAQGFMSIVGSVSGAISITPNIEYNRVRLFSASTEVFGEAEVSARYKWLPATDPTTTWTTAHYLERAA